MAQAWALAFPPNFWILLVVAAVCCSIGFKEFVWFLSIGYGFAVAGLGAALFILFIPSFTMGNLIMYLQALLLLVYGARLGGFLFMRERKSAAYRTSLAESGSDKRFPLGASLGVWIGVSILFCLQVDPLYFRFANGTGAQAINYIGFAISVLGFALEMVADNQKSAAKRADPHRFCDTGLFKVVRCPNYLGEIILWTGVFVSGFGSLTGLFQWLFACLGYLLIVGIMFSSARRLETKQEAHYGSDAAFRAYTAKTPILIPFVPLYTLNKPKK